MHLYVVLESLCTPVSLSILEEYLDLGKHISFRVNLVAHLQGMLCRCQLDSPFIFQREIKLRLCFADGYSYL